MKPSSIVLVLALLSLPACVSIVGGPGGISPSQFQFQSMVPLREPGPGGWKIARVIIQLVHVTDRGLRRHVHCPIEVQVPEINGLGLVTDEFAQMEAARAADIAAQRTLKQESLLAAEMCKCFRDEMQAELREFIPGTRIIQAL
jgi:hypothetical protein